MAWTFPKAASSICVSSSSPYQHTTVPHASHKSPIFGRLDRTFRTIVPDMSQWRTFSSQSTSLNTAAPSWKRSSNLNTQGLHLRAEASSSKSPQQTTTTAPGLPGEYSIPGAVDSAERLSLDELENNPERSTEKVQTLEEKNEKLKSYRGQADLNCKGVPPIGGGQRIYELDASLEPNHDHLDYRTSAKGDRTWGAESTADLNGSSVIQSSHKFENNVEFTERFLSEDQSDHEMDIQKSSEASTSSSWENSLAEAELLSSSAILGRKHFKNRFLLLAKLGTTLRKQLESFFKSEIRQRALVTVLMLIAVRAGHFIPLPGFDRRFMPGDYLSYPSGAGEGVGDMASDVKLSLFQLGIGPYMGASIIMQVLCYIIPQLVRLRKEGSEGVKRIKQYTERLALAIAVVQAFIISMQSIPYSVYAAGNRLRFVVTSTALMSFGAFVINWICNQITDSGFGQGPSLFICVNILTGYADSLYKVVSSLIYGGGNWGPTVFALFGFSLCFTVCAVLTSAGQRKIKLQYYHFGLAPSAGASRLSTEVEPYIPFNINPTGMQPLLATTILLSLPGFFARIYKNRFWTSLKDVLTPGSSTNPLLYYMVTVCFIFLFNILDLGNLPVEVNQYLMKIGARIPGIKPGHQTVQYLSKVQASTRFWGGLMLSLLVITSTLVDNQFRHLHHGDTIGFTSMLIIVGAILDLRRTYLAYNVMPSLSKVLKRLEA